MIVFSTLRQTVGGVGAYEEGAGRKQKMEEVWGGEEEKEGKWAGARGVRDGGGGQ